MSRSLEDILFGAPSPQAQTVTRVVNVVAVVVLLLMAAAVVFRFHSAGQLEPRLWEFFARPTTWAFLGKGLLGTLASAAMAAEFRSQRRCSALPGMAAASRWGISARAAPGLPICAALACGASVSGASSLPNATGARISST